MDVIPENVFLQTPSIDLEHLQSRTEKGVQSPFKVWAPLANNNQTTSRKDTNAKINQYISQITLNPFFERIQSVSVTLLMAMFFDQNNVIRVHDDIVKAVQTKIKKIYNKDIDIGPQSIRELVLLMHDTFLVQGAQLNESSYDFEDLLLIVQKEVSKLNKFTQSKAVSIIMDNMKQQLIFRTQQKKNRASDIPMPVSTSKSGTLQYRDGLF
jgi:hypothetical protein